MSREPTSRATSWVTSPLLRLDWLEHGFGLRDSPPPPGATTVRQIHSARVLDACGRRGEQLGEADAIVSAEPGVAIGIRTADCVPILIADPVTRMIAAIHAGWRGTAANITGATVRELVARGSRAPDLCVAIGPSIASCCYEVSADVAKQFEPWLPPATYRSPDPSFLDLPRVNEIQLLEAGVENVWKSGECTFCHPDRFFSFRREKEMAGRMFSFVNRLR